MNPKPHLEVDFSVSYGDLIFRYQLKSDADILVLAGPSGYGKSTFLNALMGTNKVTGFIKFSQTWFSSEEKINIPIEDRPLAWVPQSHFLFPHLNIRENLTFALADNDSFSKELDWLIAALEIEPILEKRPQIISGGEAQRVAIGRALMSSLRFSNGGLLLLDEPYASLDSQLMSKISGFVFDWCEKFGIKPVFSVHEIDRIGAWRELDGPTIHAYLLEKREGEVRTKAFTLPTLQKNV